MQIFSPDLVGAVAHKETGGAPEAPVTMHSHDNMTVLAQFTIDEQGNLLFKGAHVGGSLSNADVLARFSVVDNVLQFDGEPVDTVGQQFVNAAILSQFSVVDEKLYFDGNPVDTTGSVFANDAVLRMFSQSEEGTLLFNGQPIESSGSSLPNADDLARLAVDENGQLTVDGAVVSGSGGSVTLSVVKLGSGTALLKGIIGTDLQTRSLVAGSNVTLDVTGDEVKINASLSGEVNAATTFKQSDGYTNSSTISNNAETRIAGAEASTSESGLLFLARLGSDVKSSITDVALPITGSVTPNTLLTSSLNGIATAFNNGRLTIPNGTTYTATSPASWFAGTVDWTIELDLWRSSSSMGTMQNIVSGWNGSIAASSIWVMFNSANTIAVRLANGASNYVEVVGSIAITDTNKHHVEINRSGGVVRIFIDGALAGSASASESVNAGTGGIGIGGTLVDINPFYGLLRNVKIYNYAKHTAAYAVPGYYADKVESVNTVSMDGKLMSSSFWKQVTSMAVTSTETASAYLKWLMVDDTGYWKWDAFNKVWVASSAVDILTQGMTTSEVKSAMVNNAWNYRSDKVGFIVALVTDGNTSPVLTDITLYAVQSADKTSGHTVESQTQTMAQRAVMKFVGMDVSDDGNKTVVTAFTDSEKFTHNGQSLASVVSDLELNKGLLGGKAVDVSTGLADGVVLAYNQAAGKFKPAVPAVGALGSGLFRTEPFTIAPGEEKTVTHQMVKDGRAVYQADQVVAGASSTTLNRMNSEADVSTTDAAVDRILARSVAKLQTGHGSASMTTLPDMPVASAGSCSYSVDDYIYWMPMIGANWAVQTAIYKAHISAPSSWTLTGDTVNAPWPVGGKVFRYKNTLFMWSNGNFYTAEAATPTKWTVQAKHASAPLYNSPGGAFLVGSKFYIVGMYNFNTSLYLNNIYMIDLAQGMDSAWTIEAKKFPTNIGRGTCYQYEDYLYIIGGESAVNTVFSDAVYRAHISDPTSWTRIGSYPVACSGTGQAVVKNGKVFVVGGHQQSAALSSVYMADATNPVAWTALTSLPATRFFTGIIEVWDGFIVAGGMQGTSVSTVYATAYKYTLTPSIAQLVGSLELAQVDLSLVQQVESSTLIANIPVGTNIKSAVRLDGKWFYYDGASLIQQADMASALNSASPLTTAVANEYQIPGLDALPVNKSELVVALQLVGTVSATPEVYAIKYAMKARDMYSPLLIASYGSSIGDLGLMHVQGDYSATNVKNKTSAPMSVVLKVYDGYGS